ncbi:uncharacterized protein LOC5503221 [Nematostella vectensis]|uniref:uncharacterized protein LOC5503221 n=1 Tax=Nematostella vectensis TaxID=45351 RepID=UPI002076EE7B|nr:uncharacterized protein LOC5503221 [Nematostella vectensis]XP_048588839.1 uncharacterized protein LOC5503221 [Nematostella vectensis]
MVLPWFKLLLMSELCIIVQGSQSKGCKIVTWRGVELDCVNAGLTSIPTDIPPNITSMVIEFNNITIIEAGSLPDSLTFLNLGSNNISTLPIGVFPRGLTSLKLSNNNISLLEKGVFLEGLYFLDLSYNQIATIPTGIFPQGIHTLRLGNNLLKSLVKNTIPSSTMELMLQNNRIPYIAPNVLSWRILTVELTNNLLTEVPSGMHPVNLKLENNRISDLGQGLISSEIKQLYLKNNLVSTLRNGSLPPNMYTLDVSGNAIEEIEVGSIQQLRYLNMEYNKVKVLQTGLLFSSTCIILLINDNELTEIQPWSLPNSLTSMDASSNRLERILPNSLAFTSLISLYLRSNKLKKMEMDLLPKSLTMLDFSFNRVSQFRGRQDGECNLEHLWMTSNQVESLSWVHRCSRLQLLHIGNNNFEVLNASTLSCPPMVKVLFISNNRIETLSNSSFVKAASLEILMIDRNNIQQVPMWEFQNLPCSNLQIVIAQDDTVNFGGIVMSGRFSKFALMRASGYICHSRGLNQFCYSCVAGTYMKENPSGCAKCPKGGFYQDQIAWTQINEFGNGCKVCPPGRYSNEEGAKSVLSCVSCPEGTKYNEFAGFRACFCRKNHHRFDRFGACFTCPNGMICSNETFTLAPGYYWKWVSRQAAETFTRFSTELQLKSDSYDKQNSKIDVSLIPMAYWCPIGGSCLGGLESTCADGYTGTLCSECTKGRFKRAHICRHCHTLTSIVLPIIVIILSIVLIIFLFTRTPPTIGGVTRALTETVLSRCKIIMGFYQVTLKTLHRMPFKTSGVLLGVFEAVKSLELGLLDVLPIECIRKGFDTETKLLLASAVNVAVLILALLCCCISPRVKGRAGHKGLRACIGAALFLLVLLFPSWVEKVFSVLPSTCFRICSDLTKKNCHSYLRSDVSIVCEGESLDRLSLYAYLGIPLVLGMPLIIQCMLRLYTRRDDEHVKQGMRFLYEGYKPEYYYWELIEMYRQFVVVSSTVLMDAVSRTFIVLPALISGIYAVVFAYVKPMKHTCDHVMQITALIMTTVNAQVAILIRIPEDELEYVIDRQTHSDGLLVLVLIGNILVLLIAGGYLIFAITTFLRTTTFSPYQVAENRGVVGGHEDNQGFVGDQSVEGDKFIPPSRRTSWTDHVTGQNHVITADTGGDEDNQGFARGQSVEGNGSIPPSRRTSWTDHVTGRNHVITADTGGHEDNLGFAGDKSVEGDESSAPSSRRTSWTDHVTGQNHVITADVHVTDARDRDVRSESTEKLEMDVLDRMIDQDHMTQAGTQPTTAKHHGSKARLQEMFESEKSPDENSLETAF